MSNKSRLKLLQKDLFGNKILEVTPRKDGLNSDLSVVSDLKKMGMDLIEVAIDEINDCRDNNFYVIEDDAIVILSMSGLRWYRIIDEMIDIIMKLTSLKELIICEGAITRIPNSISNLKNLTYLNLRENCIKEIPDSLFSLPNLELLILEINEIEKISSNIIDLKNIHYISLAINKIKEIPTTLLDFSDNVDILLEDNPIEYLIPESKSLSSRDFIKYVLSIQDKKTKPLNEAKILVLGDEDVGKTSIVNRIIYGQFDNKKNMTEGIDIQNHNLSNDIKVNVWDFAGQEVTHQTHQFFLSSRSLYLLVLDAQKEDNDLAIYDWLEIINSNTNDSPILIVVNKIDKNGGYHFDYNRYKKYFPSIIDVIYTSAQDNKNIDKLIKCIENSIEKIKDIKKPFNINWFTVKEELEVLSKKSYCIESIEFEKVCEQNNITDLLDQEALLNLLDEIGTIVKYENNLNNIQVLNPIWVTNAVYKVIRSELLNKDGILKKDSLCKIFNNDTRYKKRHYQWIIDLFIQFELAFKINDDEILIPSKLLNNEPGYDSTKFQVGLNHRYKYEGRLKNNIISRFIVKMSEEIDLGYSTPYWKRGVFLRYGNSKAIVISKNEKKVIDISIDSEDIEGREFLSIIRREFDAINKNKNVLEEVPLINDREIVGYKDFEELKLLEKVGETTIYQKIDNNGILELKKFQISSLLNGYEIEKSSSFNYEKLTKDLIDIALLETLNRNSIYKESEDDTNDRFRNALIHRKYNVSDQSRGGESSSGIKAGERDLVIRNRRGIEESIIEAFILTSFDSTVINKHYEKLLKRYDTTGNRMNFVLVYFKDKNFDYVWKRYVEYDKFNRFVDTKDEYSQKANVKVGVCEYNGREICHLFINFYSISEKQ